MSGPAPAYVDEIAVERAAKGDRRVPLNRHEVAAAFWYLQSHGYSAARISAILGVSPRAVFRWRSGRFPQGRALSGPLAERRGIALECAA